MTGDTLFSQRCDCGPQLQLSLKKIAQEGRGLLIYLRQEGRGIGLTNKIRAYSLQEKGLDTVASNHHLGFEDDLRNYELCRPILSFFGIRSIRLMTNNPEKIHALESLGYEVIRVPLVTSSNKFNNFYLTTKVKKMGHLPDLLDAALNSNIAKD
jgi:GTP cyclohydrolase II